MPVWGEHRTEVENKSLGQPNTELNLMTCFKMSAGLIDGDCSWQARRLLADSKEHTIKENWHPHINYHYKGISLGLCWECPFIINCLHINNRYSTINFLQLHTTRTQLNKCIEIVQNSVICSMKDQWKVYTINDLVST